MRIRKAESGRHAMMRLCTPFVFFGRSRKAENRRHGGDGRVGANDERECQLLEGLVPFVLLTVSVETGQ